jgi:hypothetical protein
MPLALASTVFHGSESLGARDHILLPQILDFPFRRLLGLAGSRWRYSTPPPHGCLTLPGSESESYVTTDGQSTSLSWYKAPIRGLRPDFFSVRNTEYIWQLCSLFRGTPSLTRGRVCLLYMPLALASADFLGRSPLGLATVFYCLRSETSLFVASYDSQGHGGGIRSRLHTGECLGRPVFFKITPRHGPQRKHAFPYSDCCSR